MKRCHCRFWTIHLFVALFCFVIVFFSFAFAFAWALLCTTLFTRLVSFAWTLGIFYLCLYFAILMVESSACLLQVSVLLKWSSITSSIFQPLEEVRKEVCWRSCCSNIFSFSSRTLGKLFLFLYFWALSISLSQIQALCVALITLILSPESFYTTFLVFPSSS